MSYLNYLDHPKFGRVWYEARLRNWWCMGLTAEENRARGPLVEVRLPGYLVSAAGGSVKDAEKALLRTLDAYVTLDRGLPRWTRRDGIRHWLVVTLSYRVRHPLRWLRFWWRLRNKQDRVRIPR